MRTALGPMRRVRDRCETLAIWGMFLTLPIERVLVLEASGFTIRPVYPFMAALIFLHAGRIRHSGIAGVVAGLIVGAVVVSAVTSESPRLTAGYTAWAVIAVLFFVATVGAVRESRDRLEFWVQAYITTGALWGVFALAQWLLSFFVTDFAYAFLGSLPRVHGLAFEPSFFAFYLIPPLLLSLRTVQVRSTGLTLIGVILSTSRTGLVGLVAGGAALTILAKREVAKRMVVAGLALGVALTLAAVVSRGSYLDFVANTVSLDEPESISRRLATWSEAWTVFTANPIDGAGVGAYGGGLHAEGIALGVPEADLKTTNLWLEVLAELGVLGFGALVAWIVIPVAGIWRRRAEDELTSFVLAALLASTAMLAFVQTWWVPYHWTVWIIAYGLAFPLATGSGVLSGQTAASVTRRRRTVTKRESRDI